MRSRTRPSENTNKERAWGDEASSHGSRLSLKVEVLIGEKWVASKKNNNLLGVA